MRILIYLHHPAHFHLFKHTIVELKRSHDVIVLATKKDILEELLSREGIEYHNVLPEGRRDNKFSIAFGLLKQDLRLLKICIERRPNLLVGTSTEITHVGKLLGIPSIFVNEDDVEVIPLVGKLAYPFAKHILTPGVCSVGRFKTKALTYPGYHELAYLHPNNFTPDRTIVEQYFPPNKPYFILRFAKLKAHHDNGVKGIDSKVAARLIEVLTEYGDVYISAERSLEPEFEKYRIAINPLHMHHVLAFSKLYVGDSQTMAAEAGVLGTPFVRFNDFVGRISYLRELEETYQLGFGVKADQPEELLETVKNLLSRPGLRAEMEERRTKMLAEKVDLTKLLVWLISNYPNSVVSMKTINLVKQFS